MFRVTLFNVATIREASFYSDQDYQYYLECLYDASQRYGVLVHAYVLMTNHVHMLMTPVKKDSISLTMQSIGRINNRGQSLLFFAKR
jgi:REP element-mobilizing transposase RayT